MKNRLILYFKKPPLTDRWFYGDRFLRVVIRLIFKRQKTSSLETVFIHLCKGFDVLNVPYLTNLSFKKIKPNDKIVVLGAGKQVLTGYNLPNKIVAGIGLITHPANWPNLFKQYPVATYLQHSAWTTAIYNRWYGANTCKIWPAGIDTNYWQPKLMQKEQVLVYVKFLWSKEKNEEMLLKPILRFLESENKNYKVIKYGFYNLATYKKMLNNSTAMIFLCEHESQGLAYQEAMAMNVPIFAWDQGFWLDENRHKWGETEPVTASAVPYFDERCGEKFKTFTEFENNFNSFYLKAKNSNYQPRNYVLENLTLQKSAERMLQIIKEVYE